MMMTEISIAGYVFYSIVAIFKFRKESILLFKNYIIYNYTQLKEIKCCALLYTALSLNKNNLNLQFLRNQSNVCLCSLRNHAT